MTVYVFDGTMDGLLTAVYGTGEETDARGAEADICQLAVGTAGTEHAVVPLYM